MSYEDDDRDDRSMFADPGGRSALRAANGLGLTLHYSTVCSGGSRRRPQRPSSPLRTKQGV